MKNNSLLLIGSILLTGLGSCLKDKDQLDPEGSKNLIEFINIGIIASPTTSTYPLYNVSYELLDETSLEMKVSFSGAESSAPEDITVNIDTKPDALTTYNTENSTTFIILPDNLFSIPSKTVVIPKGQKQVTFTVKFKPKQFDLSKKYALPLTISSASYGTISGNFSTNIISVVAKNKYDGVYSLRSRQGANDRGFPTTPFTWLYDVSLITTGPNTVAMHSTGYGNDHTHPLLTATGVSRFGSYAPVYVFDASDKITDAPNFHVNPANGRGGKLNSAVTDNRYDVNTKTVYASVIMTQPGFADFIFYDTLVYKGPRP